MRQFELPSKLRQHFMVVECKKRLLSLCAFLRQRSVHTPHLSRRERAFFFDDLLVRIYYIIVMIRWTGLAPWKFESPFPGSLASTFLVCSVQTPDLCQTI